MRHSHNINIGGIGAAPNQLLSCGATNFDIDRPDSKGKLMAVEALILSKITSALLLHPVSLNVKWKHLDSLQFADPEFGMPGHMDLLLGADIFSCVVFHSRRFGTSGSPSTFKMQFGWVLAGAVHLRHTTQGSTNLCYIVRVDHHRRDLKSG